LGGAVGSSPYLPAAFVFAVVVSAAQAVEVGFDGVRTVERDDVVDLAAAGGAVAADHAAGAVAGLDLAGRVGRVAEDQVDQGVGPFLVGAAVITGGFLVGEQVEPRAGRCC
jgi:hypothetical protein